jgi:hypothetical protein
MKFWCLSGWGVLSKLCLVENDSFLQDLERFWLSQCKAVVVSNSIPTMGFYNSFTFFDKIANTGNRIYVS